MTSSDRNPTPLDRLRRFSIPITWETIRYGFEGFGEIPGFISESDVLQYALDRSETEGVPSQEVAELLYLSPADSEDIGDILGKIGPRESAGATTEERKWRLVLLDDLISKLPDDPIDSLMELTDFWARFDYPADSPHIVQGRGNEIPPTEYYTASMRDRLVEAHRQWVTAEANRLTEKIT